MSPEYRNQPDFSVIGGRALRRLGSAWNDHAERNAAIVLCALTAFWLLDQLVPTFNQLGHHDDMSYIRSGHWLVAHGELRVLAWGPLHSLLYGLPYAVVQGSPDWFVWTAVGGRLATFALFALGLYLCARASAPKTTPYAALVIGLTWPVAASFFAVWNSSDFLFMAMSALALSRLLAYLSDRTPQHLLWGSACAGLAALTRPDGLILAVSFAALSYATFARDAGALLPSGWRKPLIAAVAPAALLVGGYYILYGTATGSWNSDTMSRSYTAFEQGHGVIFRERYPGPGPLMNAGLDDVRALFGTRTDNESSVIRAIASNPPAFLERVGHSLALLPERIGWAFGGPLAVALLCLASRGALSLWRTRQRWTLVVLLGWHLHMASYFLTFWRPGYVRFAFVALVLLAGAGAHAVAGNWRDWRERAATGLVLVGLTGWLVWDGDGWMRGDPGASVLPITLALLAGMALFVPTLTARCQGRGGGRLLSLFAGVLMVSTVAVAAGRSPAGHLPLRVGESPGERAAAAAGHFVPPGVPIAGQGGRMQAAARRPTFPVGQLMRNVSLGEPLETWQGSSRAGAIYLNPFMRRIYGREDFGRLLEQLTRHPRWRVAFSDAPTDTWLFVRRSVLQVRDAWRSREPELRSGFDVYVLDGLLVYVKEDCAPEDTARRFFVHVAPVDLDVLPERQRTGGIEHLSFDFGKHGWREGRSCVAIRMLPVYAIDTISTGQYMPGQKRFWQGRIEFPRNDRSGGAPSGG